MPLFKRVVEVQVGEKLFTNEFKISFDIQKTSQSIANSASIKIYNLSESARNSIRELDDDVVVKAGYEEYGGAKLIFKGTVLRINHKFSLPDIITEIECGDGIKALREKRQSVSYEEGTQVATVMKEMGSNLGLTVRELPKDLTGEFLQGFSHVGSVQDGLNKICARGQCDWSVQDNELQIIKTNSASVHAPVKITRVEGLLEKLEKLGDVRKFLADSDAAINAGYRFRTFVNGAIQPGRIVTLTSAEGRFKVERVQHKGDNFIDEDFISTVEVKEITSSV